MTSHWNSSSLALLVVALLAPGARGAVSTTPDFQRDVRPILSRYCFHCHGPDDKSRKAKLRLDERDGALKELKSGETPIIPGKPDASELVRRILSSDPDEVMPPPETKHVLTDAQKQTLKAWIAGRETHVRDQLEGRTRGSRPRARLNDR